MYLSNNEVSNKMRQKLIEPQELDESSITVGDFNALLSEINKFSRQKIGKDTVELNDTIIQLDLLHIYRLIHPTTAEFTLFSSSH